MCELKNNEYLKTMKPMLNLMKLTCALPICLQPQNKISYVMSSRVVSCMAIATYTIMHIRIIHYLITDVLMDENITNIITLVAKGPDILLELFCLVGPMLMWSRHKEIQDYWDTWENFQSNYEAISGTPYVSRKKRYVKTASQICITWIILRYVYAAWFHYYIFLSEIDFLAYGYLLFQIYVTAIYWFANCAYFWSISEDILILGKKIILEKKEDEKLNKIISLWSDLNDLTNHFIDAHSFLFLGFVTIIVISIVTYSYTLLHYSRFKVIYPLTFYCNLLFIFTVILLIICESAYSIHVQIHYRQKEALLQENTMKIEPAALKTVLRFLQTISLRDSPIVLNGFVTLNRMEFPTIVSLCINYLIVLRQFSGD